MFSGTLDDIFFQPFPHRAQGKIDALEMHKCGFYALFIEPDTFNLTCRVFSVDAYSLTNGFSQIWPLPPHFCLSQYSKSAKNEALFTNERNCLPLELSHVTGKEAKPISKKRKNLLQR